MIDLHSHSLYSDGSDTPEKLVDKALQVGLSALALTDHDTVRGVKHAAAAAEGTDLEIIPGVELSTFYKRGEVHIVGLFVDCNNKGFLEELGQICFIREERNRKMCARLNIMGVDIDYDNLIEIYGSKTITRSHIADYMLNKGIIKERREAFDKYIGSGCPAHIRWEKITAEHGIELIKSAGGVPILAHPVAYKLTDAELEELLIHLKKHGLEGMEVFYSTNSKSFTDKSLHLARKHDLIISGGSDYHGRTKPLISLGTGLGGLKVSDSLLPPIREAIGRPMPQAEDPAPAEEPSSE